MEERARDWWNAWADHFQSEYGDGEIDVGIDWGPGAPKGDDLGLLGDVDGTDVIELGCGGAQFGLALAERGADVTGVDISAEQLSHARANADERDADVDLIEASVTDLSTIDDSVYDLAVSAFAFQWVADLESCFAEASRVLTDGGRLVFSVDHPYYKLLDPDTGEVERSYFDPTPRREYSDRLDAEMVIHRRGVAETINLLIDAGFTIDEVREPGHADPAEYVSEFGSFDPELMATVPPTVVYAARNR
jgi:SAM-dependent methyltransferase